MKLIGIGLTAIATSLIALPSIAEIAVIKTVERGRNVVYVKGATVNQEIQMESSSGTRPTAILANNCGMIRLRSNQHNGVKANISGKEHSLTQLPTVATTACNGSIAPSAENFKDTEGNIYIVGLTANNAATVLVPTSGTRTARANGCGLARFTERETSPWTNDSEFTINGSSYTYKNLKAQAYSPYCRNVGTSANPMYVKYEPAN